MLATFKTLSGMQKILWSLGIFLTPLFIIGAVSPTPGMQKTAHVYQTSDLPAVVVEPTASAAVPAAPEPQVLKAETKTITDTVVIPYQSVSQEDPVLEVGKTQVAVRGVNGEKAITYAATYTEGHETNRIQTSEKITRPPVSEIKKIGTKPKVPMTVPMPKTPVQQCGEHSRLKTTCLPTTVTDNACGTDGASNQITVTLGAIDFFGIGINLGHDTKGAKSSTCQ